jgi:hypothetical protein
LSKSNISDAQEDSEVKNDSLKVATDWDELEDSDPPEIQMVGMEKTHKDHRIYVYVYLKTTFNKYKNI